MFCLARPVSRVTISLLGAQLLPRHVIECGFADETPRVISGALSFGDDAENDVHDRLDGLSRVSFREFPRETRSDT